MGTKNNPGKYDCYAKAAPDEPIFTMRGKDVSAPYFVEMWTYVRQGKFRDAQFALAMMCADPDVKAIVGDCDKFAEALDVAEAMRTWRREGVEEGRL
jgi:hypothetical protein